MSDQEEHRRCIGRDAESGTQLRFVVFVEEAAAVDEHEEVRPAWIVQIGLLWKGPIAAIPSRVPGEVCSSREAQQPDSLRIEIPFGSVMADEAKCSLGVLHRHGTQEAKVYSGDAGWTAFLVVDGKVPGLILAPEEAVWLSACLMASGLVAPTGIGIPSEG